MPSSIPALGDYLDRHAYREAWRDFLDRFDWGIIGALTVASPRTSASRLLGDIRSAMPVIKDVQGRPVQWFAALEKQARGAVHAHVLLGGLDADLVEPVAYGLNQALPHPSRRGELAFSPFDAHRRRAGIVYATKRLAYGAEAVIEGPRCELPPLSRFLGDEDLALIEGR